MSTWAERATRWKQQQEENKKNSPSVVQTGAQATASPSAAPVGQDDTPSSWAERARKYKGISAWRDEEQPKQVFVRPTQQTATPPAQEQQMRSATLKDVTLNALKQGYYNSLYGRESYNAMMGEENEKEKYEDILAGEEYQYEADSWWKKALSGAANLLGQQAAQLTDNRTLNAAIAGAGTFATGAAIAGQAGPQVLVPEEVITVPAAAIAGFKSGMTAGSATSNFEIEAGFAYNEMLEQGISEDTAKTISLAVGGGNAALEFLQLDELLKSFKVLNKSGATQGVAQKIAQELMDRGVDIGKETLQEVAQEGVTIAGTQAASKYETGDWAYDAGEVAERLGETAGSAALSFGAMNVPSAGLHIADITLNQQDGGAVQQDGASADTADTTEQAAPWDGSEALRKAAEQVAQGGTVTNSAAERILADQEAVGVLMESAGMDLTPEMTIAQQRSAVKAAVDRLARPQAAVSEEAGATSHQSDAGAESAPGDALTRALANGKRVEHTALTEEQVEAWNDHEDVWMDAEGKVYQMDPTQHISQRTYDSVGSQKVRAFQFDHPELRYYYQQAASDLIKDASLSLDFPRTRRMERGSQGKRYITEILESPALRSAMDMGLSRNDIIQAAEDLIADHGQENYAAAKRLEFVLDDMLTEGYTTVEGENIAPNELYVRTKEGILGYQPREREELPIWDIDIPEERNATGPAPLAQAAPATERGRNAAELAYDIQQVRRAATALGENGSRALTAAYDESVARYHSPAEIVESFSQVYHAALSGKPLSEASAQKAASLPAQLRHAAESAAQQDSVRAEQAKYFGENAGLVRDANWKKANLSSKDSRTLDALGKALGVKIRFAPTVAGGAANAQYKDGTITLALDATDPVMTSVVHEIVHRVRETAPEAYADMVNFVRGTMSEEGLDFNLALRGKLYQTADLDYMTEEMVADAFGRMMEKDALAAQFAQQHRSAAQKVADAVRDIVNAVKRILRRQNLRLSQAQKDAFRDLEKRLGAMERVFADALKLAATKQAGTLQAVADGATMVAARNSLKEDLENGRARKETRAAFLQRAAGTGYAVYEGKTAAYGFRRAGHSFAEGDRGRVTPEAQGTRRELKALGISADIVDGPILRNHGGVTTERSVPEAVTVDRSHIFINKDTTISPRNIAGHEAFHLWKRGAGRDAYVEIIEDNLLFTSEAFREYQSAIAEAYLGGEADLNNDAQMEKLREELFAYISGDIHEGVHDDLLRAMLRDFDAVKAAWNRLAELNSRAKFSLKSPVEETDDLLALHNLSEASLLGDLELGGLPMPSIAVVKAAAGHAKYGDISLVFSKDTIDPNFFRANKVYGGDAWTPTFPAVEYKVNEKTLRRVKAVVDELMGGYDARKQIDRFLSLDTDNMTEALNRNGGDPVEAFRDSKGLKYAYLKETNPNYAPPSTGKPLGERAGHDDGVIIALAEAFGADAIRKMREGGYTYFREREDTIREMLEIVNDYYRTHLDGYDTDLFTDLSFSEFDRLTADTYSYTKNGQQRVIDTKALREYLEQNVDQAAYEAWLEQLFDGIVEKRGIRNEKDLFTPQGNRRSFDALHYEVTLENIVKAMKKDTQKGGGAMFGGNSIWGVATKDYGSIHEIKEDSGRLGTLPDEEYDAIRQEYSQRLADMALDIRDPRASNSFIATDDAAAAIIDTLRKKRTVAAIDKELRTYTHLNIRSDTAEKALALFRDISNMPVGYFEAKPQRAVGFDEVLAAVVPSDSSKKLREALVGRGVNVLTYESGNEADRLAKVNSVKGARFSLKEDNQGRKLTKAQADYFKDSKAVDERGNLLVLYHGTKRGGFTVFREWAYLTADKKYAKRYTDPSTGETMYEVYANIRNPFDTRLPECRELFQREYTGHYSNTPLQESGLPDWTDGYDLLDFIEENGYDYDAILLDEGADPVGGKIVERGISYVVRSPEQIKRTDNLNPTADPDIRWSRSDRDLLDAYVKQYGAIPKGEKPSREIVLPRRTGEDKKLSQTVRTILEAGATPEEAIPNIEKLAARGDFSYDTYTDKQAVADAESSIRRKGWGRALADWEKAVESGEVSKKNTAMGWALYNNAANSGDVKTAIDVLGKMVEHQRSAAQALQATRILKKMSPETQLYQVQRSVENLQEELNARFGDKDGPTLEIDTALAERFMRAENQEERDAALRDIYRDIGRQMPSRFRDKWNAWRYLAMLGNPRTHVRNVVGNAGFAPVVAAKDLTATAIEAAVGRLSGGRLKRSKGAIGFSKKDRALLSAAWGDYAKVQETALSGGKYSDFANANRYIEEGRVIFKNRALEAARKANSKALDAEDVWFSKPHYAVALAQFCKAHNITAGQVATGKGLKQARAYAILEAQKATYRDTNALSQTIGELGRTARPGKNPVRKGVGLVMEGILPFRKTPANILARGIEYSPLGLMNGIKEAVWDVRKGRKTGAEAIDHISAGLTGTGLLALGLYMAAQGLVRGHGGGDEEENEFAELAGHQAYALELPDGTSITLDWLAPECLPFFVGVNLWEQTGGEEEKATLSAILSSVATVSEPLLEMSCLQSLNEVFDAVGYASSEGLEGLPAALASAATSYLTQALPTVLGQAERTGEDQRYTTYTEKNAFLTGDMQYTLGRASARLPGLEYQQIPYIDAWGRVERTGDPAARAFNNFINPAYTSTIDTSEMEDELLRLYQATGEGGVLPSRAAKYFVVDGERKDLTAEEYVLYATKKGQRSYDLVSSLVSSEQYRGMSDAEKVRAVKEAYDLANQTAKAAISEYETESWMQKAEEAERRYGIPAETYIAIRTRTAPITSLKDKDGETIENSKSLLVMQEVYNTPGLTDAQREAMFVYLGVGKKVQHYNKAAVQEALEKMQKQAAG